MLARIDPRGTGGGGRRRRWRWRTRHEGAHGTRGGSKVLVETVESWRIVAAYARALAPPPAKEIYGSSVRLYAICSEKLFYALRLADTVDSKTYARVPFHHQLPSCLQAKLRGYASNVFLSRARAT